MESCGAELAEGAVIPELIALLLEHVAANMVLHAEWVGTARAECLAENLSLLRVAEFYLSSASSARAASRVMLEMEHLEPAPHDPNRWDRVAFSSWMHRKIALQTRLGELLLTHADASRRVFDSHHGHPD